LAVGNGACALVQGTSAKEVWCWGYNAYGSLGTGDKLIRKYPTKVLGLTAPTQVLMGGATMTTCAIDAGNVRCWGYNGYGSVGDVGQYKICRSRRRSTNSRAAANALAV